jgi:hypothetical protein
MSRTKEGRDALRSSEAHPQARSIAPPRSKRSQRRVPLSRHRPKSAKTGPCRSLSSRRRSSRRQSKDACRAALVSSVLSTYRWRGRISGVRSDCRSQRRRNERSSLLVCLPAASCSIPPDLALSVEVRTLWAVRMQARWAGSKQQPTARLWPQASRRPADGLARPVAHARTPGASADITNDPTLLRWSSGDGLIRPIRADLRMSRFETNGRSKAGAAGGWQTATLETEFCGQRLSTVRAPNEPQRR